MHSSARASVRPPLMHPLARHLLLSTAYRITATMKSTTLSRFVRLPAITAALCALAVPALAQTTVSDAWVRATVPQQKATGAFMQIMAARGGKLVAASSPAAGVVEIHEMAMEGNVMRMRAVPALALPAGKAVELKPGGYHVMLMDLKAPVPAGESVRITLTVEGPDGKRETVEVSAPAKAMTAATPAMHKH